jgi:hypothetical protein
LGSITVDVDPDASQGLFITEHDLSDDALNLTANVISSGRPTEPIIGTTFLEFTYSFLEFTYSIPEPEAIDHDPVALAENALQLTPFIKLAKRAKTPETRAAILRDLIAVLPDVRFDMRRIAYDFAYGFVSGGFDFRHSGSEAECLRNDPASAGCILGWITFLTGQPSGKAQSWLGGKNLQWHEMYEPPNFSSKGRYTRQDAIAMLDRFIETGKVIWHA